MAKGPSSFNWFTVVLLIAIAGAVYGTVKFFPIYWTAWQIDHVLADGASRAYPVSRLGDGAEKARAKEKLIADLRREVVELGVKDPEMGLWIELGANEVVLTCTYREYVVHPFIDRFTMLSMTRKGKGSLERPKF